MHLFIEISGWVFGLISCIVAIIQTMGKNRYKKMSNNLKASGNSTIQQATTKENSTITQIGGTYDVKK